MTLPVSEAKKIFQNPNFLDYREKSAYLYFAGDGKKLKVGDIVADQYNILGYVKFMSEEKGAFVQFIDGIEGYTKELNLKFNRVPGANINQFSQHVTKFGELAKVGRIMVESLKKTFPHAHMFNNGEQIFVRASTNKRIVTQFTKVQLAHSHSFFSAVLIPRFKVVIDSFIVKYADQKSRFSYTTLKNLFQDLDQGLDNRSRFKWHIEIGHDDSYNLFVWRVIHKTFSKFQFKDIEHKN